MKDAQVEELKTYMSTVFMDDIKQFVFAVVSQSEARIETKFDSRINDLEIRIDYKINGLRQEMLDGFAGVAEAITEMNERIDKRLIQLEKVVFNA